MATIIHQARPRHVGRLERRRPLLAAAAALAAIALAACGVNPDGQVRDIGERVRAPIDTSAVVNAGASTGASRIYLLSPEIEGQERTIEPVARTTGPTARSVLQSLFDGPNASELDQQLRTAIPANTTVLSTRTDDTVLQIDLSKEIEQVTGPVLIQAIAQIVFTSLDLPGVSAVRITVEGRSKQWPAANGELQGEPLTSYDYPGVLKSSQPAFPPVPAQPAT